MEGNIIAVAIGKTTVDFRQLGIGYANLGALLMASGLPYDSDAGRAMAASITSLMTGVAYRRSAELASVVGAYNGYARNSAAHVRVMRKHAAATDKPVAALLADLKTRGLLEDTLVWWGGEFGRTPFSQNKDGRDHNPKGFTVWLAGGGIKPGFSFGQTDEFGHEAVEDRVHMHDLHATVLHLLGLDHERLTWYHNGLEQRLTGFEGHGEIRELLA